MRSKFLASRKLPPHVRGPFWAALASHKAHLPSRLMAAALALVSTGVQRPVEADRSWRTAPRRQAFADVMTDQFTL